MLYNLVMLTRYALSAFFFRFAYRLDNTTYLFPSDVKLDITYIPTPEDVKVAPGPVFFQGKLTFKHGLPWSRKTAEAGVYKQPSFFQPTFWRWAANGELTPGFLVERLESQWHQQRQAMNARLQRSTHA